MEYMEYMNLIPDEVETLIFKNLSYMDLKHYAQTSRARTNLVYRHLAPIARRARERFGLGPRLRDQDIIERLYHVNGYTSSAFDNVTVHGGCWRGPGGLIIRPLYNPDDLLWYNISGQLHREDGPAEIRYENNRRFESWFINGQRHRRSYRIGPAVMSDPAVIVYEDGNIRVKRWFEDNMLHRIDGPAVINYNDAGNVIVERWFEDNTLHRIVGPAVIEYDDVGNVRSERYYMHGMVVNPNHVLG